MVVAPLNDRVRKNALLLHDAETLAAYVEMDERYGAYREAVAADADNLQTVRRELFLFRAKQRRGKVMLNGNEVGVRALQSYVDASLYLAWAMRQINEEEEAEASEPLCECRLSVVVVRHGRRWCGRCKRFKEWADA